MHQCKNGNKTLPNDTIITFIKLHGLCMVVEKCTELSVYSVHVDALTTSCQIAGWHNLYFKIKVMVFIGHTVGGLLHIISYCRLAQCIYMYMYHSKTTWITLNDLWSVLNALISTWFFPPHSLYDVNPRHFSNIMTLSLNI